MADPRSELRYAFRRLVRSPVSTVAVLLTLGLGIGANLAIFSVVRATLVRPLPYARPDRLVVATWQGAGGKSVPLSPAELEDLRRGVEGLQAVAAYHPWTFNVTGLGPAERLPGAVATADLFPVLGVEPALGRGFAGDGPEAPGQVILSDGLWHRRFGADPSVLGKKLVLDGQPMEIVGVMPPSFRFPVTRKVELWRVSPYDSAQIPRDTRFLLAVGRLADGASFETVAAQVAALAKRLDEAYPELNEGLRPKVTSMRQSVVGGFERNLFFLQTAVVLALLLAWFNVTMLQLGRAEARREEMDVRLALGAGRRGLLRLFFWESLLLGIGGGALGLVVARLGVPLLVRFGPSSLYRLESARAGWSELGLALGATLLSVLIIGQVPFWIFVGRREPKEGRRRLSAVLSPLRVRRVLVSVQVAVTLVLLSSFALFLRSVQELSSVPLGFEPDGVLVYGLMLPEELASLDRSSAFFHELQAHLGALPGVESVATAVSPPLAKSFRIDHEFALAGRPTEPGAPKQVAAIRPVSPGFFELLHIPVLAGRAFTDADDDRSLPVAVVNRRFANAYFEGPSEGRTALGAHVLASLDYGATVGSLPHDDWEIVGVVGDVQQLDLETEETPAIYVSTLQAPWMETKVLVKSGLSPSVIAPRAEAAIRALVPDLPVLPASDLRDVAAATLGPARFQSGMLGVFAGFALLLMAVGLYGTLAYGVAQRSREIGLRMALGAKRWQTRWLVVRQALALVGIGVLAGGIAALFTGRLIAGLLFGVAVGDPLSYAGGAALVLLTALVACWLPARRATGIDPARALRCE